MKQQMFLWSRIHLSYGERCLVLKVFILSGLVYWLSLVTVPEAVVGLKRDGGCGLPHIQSMIEAYRVELRRFVPRLWSNMTPYID